MNRRHIGLRSYSDVLYAGVFLADGAISWSFEAFGVSWIGRCRLGHGCQFCAVAICERFCAGWKFGSIFASFCVFESYSVSLYVPSNCNCVKVLLFTSPSPPGSLYNCNYFSWHAQEGTVATLARFLVHVHAITPRHVDDAALRLGNQR